MRWLSEFLFATSVVSVASTDVPYKEYILAPSSRIVRPVSVRSVNGTVSGAENILAGSANGSLVIHPNTTVTYDFGKNIGGWVNLEVGASNTSLLAVTFSESSLWISSFGCDATADGGLDEPLLFDVSSPGKLEAPPEKERGGFKYLSLIHNGTGTVELTDLYVYFTAMPHWPDDGLRDYTGYFHSSDEQINRIWYAGAYTNQMVTIDSKRGDALIHLGQTTFPLNTWYFNQTIANGTSVLTDGAKRDRLVWAGDMAIAVPSIAVATSDFITIENSLDSLFTLQLPNGLLPYEGIPEPIVTVSFTYHLYSLIGVANHYQWTGNLTYVARKWDQWKLGMNWSLSSVDSSGMMYVTSPNDWLRSGMCCHNIEANSILYYTLNQGILLARALNDSSVVDSWTTYAAGIKSAANALLWNETAGLFHDAENSTLLPQDGNVWAVKSGVADAARAAIISESLAERWGPFGAPAPEANAVSPFISGFELETHFMVNQTQKALDLVRMMWGNFMLDDPRMTNSTWIEGYSANGSLHYAPYTNDPRVSHAHGWSSGPTSSMTTYIAGIQLLSEAGATWQVVPQIGDLRYAEAGLQTSVGSFSSSWKVDDGEFQLNITAPASTTGKIGVPIVSKVGAGDMKLHMSGETRNIAADEHGRYWVTSLTGHSVYSLRVTR